MYRFACLLLVALAACKTLAPEGPEERYDDVTYQPPLSVLTVPVEIQVAQLQRRLNQEIDDTLYVDNDVTDDNVALRVTRRAPLRITPEGEVFHLTVPLHVWARGGVSLKQFGIDLSRYEETAFAVNVRFDTRLRVDSAWQLRTETQAAGFEWISRPTLNIAGLRVPIGRLVEGVLERQQREIAREIDRSAGRQVDLRTPVAQAWTALQQPVLLSEAYDTWLRVRPTQVVITPLSGGAETIRGQIGLRGYAETFTGRQPPAGQTPLPPLQTVDQVPSDFEVGLLAELSYAKAEALLGAEILDTAFTFQNGKRTVRITSLRLYGSGPDLVAALQLAGDVEGKIYLQGKPRYDDATQQIVVDDLDYVLSTRNALAQTAAWLGRAHFAKQLEKAFRFPVGGQMDTLRAQLTYYLDGYAPSPQFTLNGALNQLQPGRIFVTREGIRALVVGRGQVRLTLQTL